MKVLEFSDVFEDITSKFHKIKKEDYLTKGSFPIIDQGQTYIGGFSNDKKLISEKNLPVVIFGDHTKKFKYVDFPFTIGADGVKVLSLRNRSFCAKYFYYYLRTLKLPESGYSRHFKYLKNTTFSIPERIEDQFLYSDILSKAESLIAQRKESIRMLDEFLKSTFLEMFGDPVRNEKGWESSKLGHVINIKHGFAFSSEYFAAKGEYVLLTPGNYYEEGGYRDRGEKQKYYIGEIPKDYLLKKGDLLVAMTEQAAGLLGSAIIVPESDKFLHNQRLGLVEFDSNKCNTQFLFFLFNYNSIRFLIHAKATGIKVRHTSPGKIQEISVGIPPLEVQIQFAYILEKTEVLKTQYKQSLADLEKLYCSLSQKAFKGS